MGNLAVNSYPLEDIDVPTLVVHARDDTMASCASAEAAVKRIPGARLVVHPRGGHLMLGQQATTGAAVSDFLGSLAPSDAPPRRDWTRDTLHDRRVGRWR